MTRRSRSRALPASLPGAALTVLASLAAFACDPSSAPGPMEIHEDLDPVVAQAPAATALMAKSTFVASLSGDGAGTNSRGVGEAVFRFDPSGDEVHFRLNVANIRNVTMAHIHVAMTPGGNGPPVVWLYPDAPPPSLVPGRTQGGLGSGSFSAGDLVGPLAGMTLEDLRSAIEEERAYVNVHAQANPGGEIRGTIQ
jgi:hypothetical protein